MIYEKKTFVCSFLSKSVKIAILRCLLGGPPGNPRGTPEEPPRNPRGTPEGPPRNPRGTPGEPLRRSRKPQITQNYENDHKLHQMYKMVSKSQQMHSEVQKCTRRLHNYSQQAKTHKPNQYVQKLEQNGPRAILATPQASRHILSRISRICSCWRWRSTQTVP